MADSANQVIVTRGIMGVGAALVMPATLSILVTVFPPHERGRAIAVWAGLAGAGAAIGPIAGGWLLEHFWWGSVFLVNIPVIAVALVGGHYLVPTSRDPRKLPLDPTGAGLSIVGLGSVLYAIIEAPTHGWTGGPTLVAAGIGLVFLLLFAAWELRTPYPMLDLRFFKNPRFSSAAAAIMLVFFALFGTFFLLTQYLQLVRGYSALGAGVRALPAPLTIMVMAPLSSKVVDRFGARWVIASGLSVVALGLATGVLPRHRHALRPAGRVPDDPGHGHGDDDGTGHHVDHVVAPAGQGGRRLRRQRHHPGAGRSPRGGSPGQPGGVALRIVDRLRPRLRRRPGRSRPAVARRRPPGGGVGRRGGSAAGDGGQGGLRRRHELAFLVAAAVAFGASLMVARFMPGRHDSRGIQGAGVGEAPPSESEPAPEVGVAI